LEKHIQLHSLKKIVSILLVILLFVSNTGFSIITHYCGGEAIVSEFTISHKQLSCGMAEDQSLLEYKSCTEDQHTICSSTCCKNQLETFQNTDEYRTVNKYNLNCSSASLGSFYSDFNFIIGTEPLDDRAKYIPPLLKQNTIVLFQSFLI